MQFYAYLTSQPHGINGPRGRVIEVPDDEVTDDLKQMLEACFTWGQNEMQERDCPSLSVGDTIVLPNSKLYAVGSLGFRELSNKDFDRVLKVGANNASDVPWLVRERKVGQTVRDDVKWCKKVAATPFQGVLAKWRKQNAEGGES